MTKTIVFKTLVDILYISHFICFAGILFTVAFKIVNEANISVADCGIWHCSITILTLITYLIFLRGLYYLRKMSRYLLSNRYFSNNIIQNLKQTGYHFLFAGLLSFIVVILIFISKLYIGKIELVFDDNIIIPLFVTIIGLFFIIQSHFLLLAKNFKEENELTI